MTEPKIEQLPKTVARLVAEYRPTMDREVLHSWATDVVAAFEQTLPGVGLREALERLEAANEKLCATRSNATYDSILRDGAADDLAELDAARLAARAALSANPPEPVGEKLRQLIQAGKNLWPYLEWTCGPESPGHHPTMPSAVGAFKSALDLAGKVSA